MTENTSLLARIHAPADLKKLSGRELGELAAEIRAVIVSTVSKNGGHLASNLGVVELTIALHRVFDSPQDKIVWDVGHQCYTHKLLTGRYERFSTLRQKDGLAGFPKRDESPHDAFDTGHASTSISAALGLLAGERIQERSNSVIAVIGDGALSGGLAYEALSHAGQLALPLIVILNDNKMSIGRSVGGLSKYLSRLSMKARYQAFRRKFDSMVKSIPRVGELFFDIVVRLKRAVKAVFYIDNFFVDLGFEYVGPIEGHHIQRLEQLLRDVRRLNRPVVVHIITRKGKGYQFAEEDPGSYHGVSSFEVSKGLLKSPAAKPLSQLSGGKAVGGAVAERGLPESARVQAPSVRARLHRERRGKISFTEAFARSLLDAGYKDGRIIGITAAMEKGTGLAAFKAAFPGRFFDVGIAEEHAVTFAAGLAAKGLKPVVAVYSTFMQRAMDQIIHDVALQNLPVTFALDRAGFVGDDGLTHQGVFDVSMFRMTPNMTILAPADAVELALMLNWSLASASPCMLRYPKAFCPVSGNDFAHPLVGGEGVFLRKWNASICLAFTGSLYLETLEAAERLEKKRLPTDLYNLRFLKPVNEVVLVDLLNNYELVVFIEEGVYEGGFGEYAASLAQQRRCLSRVLTLAIPDHFVAQGKREELLRANHLDGVGIAAAVLEASKCSRVRRQAVQGAE
jgi:1-deoxy-D-xylulose-5-phosphate synthase